MLPKAAGDSRALFIQQARLGDLVQSLPAIEAVRDRYPNRPLDLLCSAPLAPVLEKARAIDRLIPWDGKQWRAWADEWLRNPIATLRSVETYLSAFGEAGYDRVYNLNQHARGILMTQLFSTHSIDTDRAKRADQEVSPWAQYLRQVAKERGENRVHLADAWCGMCGVKPKGRAPIVGPQEADLPEDLAAIGERQGLWVALVTGAGDQARCVHPDVWASWIREFLAHIDDGQVVLIGSGQEREAGQAILEATPALLQGRVWDTTGRTTLNQLMTLLGRCPWVIGADTGPLHLATAVGSRAVGLYFARARVHETGPYGEGHWVYQYDTHAQPDSWPIKESIGLISGRPRRAAPGWSLWNSRLDRWGVFFDDGSSSQATDQQRAAVWQALSPTLTESVAA
jgi:ADP-heptose:LPS heptosyltransferase